LNSQRKCRIGFFTDTVETPNLFTVDVEVFGAGWPLSSNVHETHKPAGLFTLTMKDVEGKTDTVILYALLNYQRLLRFFRSSSKQMAR
jgi:hypothetical protein